MGAWGARPQPHTSHGSSSASLSEAILVHVVCFGASRGLFEDLRTRLSVGLHASSPEVVVQHIKL